LSRERDRQSIKFAFDLWAYDDVKANAKAVLDRLEDGSMPCDGAWPEEGRSLSALGRVRDASLGLASSEAPP
jgi:hypothetical protein